VQPRVILLTSLVATAGLVLAVPRALPLWATALVGQAPWMPLFAVGAARNHRRYHWLALFYVLVVTQTGHFLEHVTQMIQIHLLGLQGPDAQGVFGALTR
jgi:hypothetical protein